MKVTETFLSGCFILEPTVFKDQRGYFFESFNQKKFGDLIGNQISFVQDNESLSTRGVLRGLHFQRGVHAQTKLVRVIKGSVLDIVVDIREGSKTFGKHFSLELTEQNKKQLLIPKGFAHGFVVLSDSAIFTYKCDNYYNKEAESGIIYNDSSLNIDWQLSEDEFVISEKDKILPSLENAEI